MTRHLFGMGLLVIGFFSASVTIALSDDPAETKFTSTTESSTAKTKLDEVRVPVAIARDRAKVMHEVYTATLDVIHHRYFHRDRATIPARAMEDIFSDIKRKSKVDARWISVNTKAMSIDHDPKTDFEKRAARELGDGKSEIEAVEEGYYRYAGPIALHEGCLSCHDGFFKAPSKTPRYAGLVISIPIREE